VTGGMGFIGSAIVKQLLKDSKHKIIVVDSLTYAGNMKNLQQEISEIEFFKSDIRNRFEMDEIFSNRPIELVINCAGESHVDRSIKSARLFLETNILGTQILLDAAIKFKTARFLQISTDEVYGSVTHGAANEKAFINPSSAYSASKASAEHLVNAAYRTFGINTGIVRCSNNFGPRQHPEKLIPLIINRLLHGEKVPLYGSGLNVREWIYVEDCAEAISLIAFCGKPNHIYNVSSGFYLSNLEITKLLLEKFNKGDEFISFIEDRKGHDFRYAIDSSKIRKELNWNPKTQFEIGLNLTLDWYLDNLQVFK
jgi:dTDP-glucose 4,6-dehydratase